MKGRKILSMLKRLRKTIRDVYEKLKYRLAFAPIIEKSKCPDNRLKLLVSIAVTTVFFLFLLAEYSCRATIIMRRKKNRILMAGNFLFDIIKVPITFVNTIHLKAVLITV